MSISFATGTICGPVGGEPRAREIQTKKGPSTVLSFSVATEYGYGERATTTWWSVDLFCNSEKARDYFMHAIGKGAIVVADGVPYQRTYTAKDGTERTVFQFKANNITVPRPAPREQDVTQPPRAAGADPELYDEDLPF